MTSYTIHCQRHGCGGRKVVAKRSEWLRRRFCSLNCSGKVNGAAGARAGLITRRARTIALVVNLAPVAAYRKGRQEGWHAGYRAAVKRIESGRAA
jgi:hypothetical protein